LELILASGSPRRRELMAMCGYDFTVIPSCEEEKVIEKEPALLVKRLAEAKAMSVWKSLPKERRAGAAVLGSDTVVVLDGEVLGKPSSKEDAVRMLRELSGRANVVHTGVALVTALPDGEGALVVSDGDEAKVFFAELDDEEIEAYVESGDPLDKAGAYGIQGAFSVHITGVEGSYFTVVGLPVHLVYDLLKRFGILPAHAKKRG
jgi:septum formation protein